MLKGLSLLPERVEVRGDHEEGAELPDLIVGDHTAHVIISSSAGAKHPSTAGGVLAADFFFYDGDIRVLACDLGQKGLNLCWS